MSWLKMCKDNPRCLELIDQKKEIQRRIIMAQENYKNALSTGDDIIADIILQIIEQCKGEIAQIDNLLYHG